MLLRQHFVRVDAQLPCFMTVQPVRTPAFRLLRHHRVDFCSGVAAAASAHSQQTAERPAETVGDVRAGSGLQTLQDAQRHAAEPAAPAGAAAEPASEWRIPPHAWGSHPTLLSGCERDSAPLRVAVLLSGGVDSSVALRLAQAAGHRVTAFYLQIWFQDDFRNFWDSCPWEEDLSFCRQVCEQAGVPLQVVPLTEAYWERVVSHSISEIKAGRTPNPDIMCNSRVKFGAFLEHLETAHAGCFDRIASGHYAGVSRSEGGQAALRMTADAVKDQTYFLAHLTQAQLARVMFPLAPLTKGGVRALAAAAGLPTQARRDSQGICFLGKVHHSEFVREHLGVWPGPLIEEDTGKVLGYHQGFWFHTIGQRKGVPLSGGPWYVVRKDITMNAVYISRVYHAAGHRRNAFRCGPFNWLSGQRPSVARLQQCKVRHGPDLYRCRVQFENRSSQAAGSHQSSGQGAAHTNGSSAVAGACQHPASSKAQHQRGDAGLDPVTAVVALDGQDQGVAPGQYAVYYDGDICLGSAVIQEAIDLHDAALLRCM